MIPRTHESTPLEVISAGRTRDLVAWNPSRLAAVLRGEEPARRGPRAPAFHVDPGSLGAVVFWTRRPENLSQSEPLAGLLRDFRQRKILAVLQLTVTGLGGSPVEPGIPDTVTTAASLKEVLDAGLLPGPDCVKLRWDPVAEFLVGRLREGPKRGWDLVLSNGDLEHFEETVRIFREQGVTRWTTSLIDLKYRAAAARLEAAGIGVGTRTDEEWEEFFTGMARVVESAGGRFAVCCNPPLEPWVSTAGCIDGQWFNELRQRHFGANTAHVEERLHNHVRRGGQRPRCRCTHSTDISYTGGFRTCGTQHAEGIPGGCCLYCYSWHGPARGKTVSEVRRMSHQLLTGSPDPAGGHAWGRAVRLVPPGED